MDIPDYTGETSELRFTETPQFCNMMAEEDDFFYITMSEEKIPGSNQLILTEVSIKTDGAWYFFGDYNGKTHNMKVLLCNIVRDIFGYYPENIYFYKDF